MTDERDYDYQLHVVYNNVNKPWKYTEETIYGIQNEDFLTTIKDYIHSTWVRDIDWEHGDDTCEELIKEVNEFFNDPDDPEYWNFTLEINKHSKRTSKK